MPAIAFDRYYSFEELTALLRAFESEFPHLVTVESIGKSHEGRDIWLATVTDRAVGAPEDKPAFWCDGNIHASELSASTAVLYLLNRLCTQYAADPVVCRALQNHTFYLVPRLGPDGAEWAMETPARIVRSSVREYPYGVEDPYGIERADLDGDGRILHMRIPDDNGPWVISETEPRLMRRRYPAESGGQYYRIVPEGLIHNWDGMTLRARRVPQGLDMNRNFPSAWRTESEQRGAGPFPTSEPEIHAAVSAICARPNICGAITYHTFSGVHLRPPSRHADDELPAEDVWNFKKLGEKGTELTGYPAISVFHEFRYHPKEVITGVFDDWMYEHRGVYAWTTELWSPQRQAGITDYKYIDWFRDHPFEDDVKLLQWSDEKLDGKGHVDWQPFDHPQLGAVEIGGWDHGYAFRNPPPNFLEAEVAPQSDWAIWLALASPRLAHRETRIEPYQGAFRVRIAVQNTGFLPTNVTEHAKKKRLVEGVKGHLLRAGDERTRAGQSPPTWLVSGTIEQDLGQLAGWDHISSSGFGWQAGGTDDVGVFEWVVAEAGEYAFEAWHDRAGRVRLTVLVES